jgi:BlaI family penicillinase repressor
MKMSLAPLANAELSVMELLWAHDRLTARQIQDQLYGESDRSQHGTVQRLLQRLEDKGLVQRERGEGAQVFRPLMTREEYASSQIESLADRLTGGSIAPLLTHLIEQKRLSRAEIRRLRDLLDKGK